MISFFNKSTMSNTSDFSNQFVALFEKIEMMTNYLKGLEQQNSILVKKVENIENYIFNNKSELSHKTAKPEKMKNENNENENDEEKDNKKKENLQRKNKKQNKKDLEQPSPDSHESEIPNDESKKNEKPNNKSVHKGDPIKKNIQQTPKEPTETGIQSNKTDIQSNEAQIIPKLPAIPNENNARRPMNIRQIRQKNENKEEESTDENKEVQDLTKSMQIINKVENETAFNIGFMGEAYVFEDLDQLGCFSKIRWNAHTNDQHNPCVILNNGHKYYIHGDGEHYDILATDKGGKNYYIEIKSTSSPKRGNQINPKQEQLRSNLSYNVRHFILAKVSNVLNDPKINYFIFNPSTGYRKIDINNEHTDEYFVKSLFENDDDKIKSKTKNNIVKPDIKGKKKNKK